MEERRLFEVLDEVERVKGVAVRVIFQKKYTAAINWE